MIAARDAARRRRALLAAVVLCGAVVGCQSTTGMGAASAAPAVISTRAALRTVPETTQFTRTSSYADVVRFLELLRYNARGTDDVLTFGVVGRTSEGRDIPYVIASRPRVSTPEQARATGKPVVYVQGNIHAGEVEGKEALLALLRDLAFATGPSVLDSIVLIAVPIYNADGNERWGPQERQRSEQNGPALVGQRPNAAGLDLNRDYIKADAPETRASLAMFTAWNPDIFVDLHTTNGSYHGYALTYAPSLSPAAPLGDYTRELLGVLRSRLRDRHGLATFDYGNFDDGNGREVSTDTTHGGWLTYDARPRFGTNYYGLRGRIAMLSEAYSHDPFEQRIRATYAFTRQLLSLAGERREELLQRTRLIRSRAGGSMTPVISIRSALPASAPAQPVSFELLARTGDSSRTEPGVPRGLRRTGQMRLQSMPVFDRFVSAKSTVTPAYYIVSGADTATLRRLREHGVPVTPARNDDLASLERFAVDSVQRADRPFQGHVETRAVGRWVSSSARPAEPWLVSTVLHPALVVYLLDPESEDGFGTWDLFASPLTSGTHPVWRMLVAPPR